MPPPDVSVALIDVLVNWRAFKHGHRLDSPEYKCCEITTEFFSSMDRLLAVVLKDAVLIDDELAEGAKNHEERLKDLANRCQASTIPGEGRHLSHFCLLAPGHEGSHKWSDCIYCRKEERY